ncbi:hypothetical protein [Alienimonas californiensis]|uniref:Uncharacterized protein n=1 Tax=Alienimonas californiensis TaxID=2527989 RepID=A0A517PCI3_9PLAN|nr:hypothetical protein [Alienimonas californiensis]QDT17051.1 hypothetical protein CA12_31620 [Alienimonas californiensis]
MDAGLFTDTVNRLVRRQPFQPFTIRLNDGSHFEVDRPHSLTSLDGLAVGFGPGNVPVWFDHDAVAKIVEDLASNSAAAGMEEE